MSYLVDTHCHLNFDWFDADRTAVLEAARAAGVERILNPGIDLPSSRSVLALAEAEPEVYAAVGVHPNDCSAWDKATLPALRDLAAHPKVVAIGEIGLDYYREHTPRPFQEGIFRQQLDLAAELGLPVVIHNRDATGDVLKILVEWAGALPAGLRGRAGVLHSFSADTAAAHKAIDLGFYIGFTGPVTFRNADDLRQVVAAVPLERTLIETDAPFLTPHPHRGERNQPAYVRFVAEKLAEIHQTPFETVLGITAENAERLFHWRVAT